MMGTVKRIDAERDFAFISGEDGREYFVHSKDMAPAASFAELAEGRVVVFNPAVGPKGLRAQGVVPT